MKTRKQIIKSGVLYIALFFAIIVLVNETDKVLYGIYTERLIEDIGGMECRFPKPKSEEPAEPRPRKQFFYSA